MSRGENKLVAIGEEAKLWLLFDTLERCKGVVAQAARELHCERTHIYRFALRGGKVLSKKKQRDILRGVRMTPEFRRFLGARGPR